MLVFHTLLFSSVLLIISAALCWTHRDGVRSTIYSNYYSNKDVYADFSDDPPEDAWSGVNTLIHLSGALCVAAFVLSVPALYALYRAVSSLVILQTLGEVAQFAVMPAASAVLYFATIGGSFLNFSESVHIHTHMHLCVLRAHAHVYVYRARTHS